MRTSLKIAFVIESLENRGAQNLMVDWAVLLQQRGFDIHIVSFRYEQSSLIQTIQKSGLPLKFFHKRSRVDGVFFRNLISYFRKEEFDIVHTHVFTANLWGQLAAMWSQIPVRILHEHGYFSTSSRFRRGIIRWLTQNSTKLCVVSDHLKKEFADKAGIPVDKIEVVRNGVDWQRFDQIGYPEGLKNGKSVVGVVGALEKRKDPFNFIRAAEKILQERNDVEFWWVGDGPFFPQVQDYLAAKNLCGRIKLWGSQPLVRPFLNQMDVFVLPSKTEGVPLSLLEAMGAGLPPVATRVGENESIISDGESGLLVPAENADALSDAIGQLIRSPKSREQFGKRARQFVRNHFSLANSVEHLVRLYTQLIEGQNDA
ncbi:MAG: glycosyltransferase family 4 protein [Calditrichaeota bacterium]|nr:glycosyltransferase family 4 protein [Calditrichota bacterium]